MTPDCEAELLHKYPEIFGDTQDVGLDVDDGWGPLVDELCFCMVGPYRQECSRAERLQKKKGEPIYHGSEKIVDAAMIAESLTKAQDYRAEIPVAQQVKEKFGELRFYASGPNERHAAMIDLACRLSSRICEQCGSMNQVQTYRLGWNKTLCPAHADIQYGEAEASQYRQKSAQKSATKAPRFR